MRLKKCSFHVKLNTNLSTVFIEYIASAIFTCKNTSILRELYMMQSQFLDMQYEFKKLNERKPAMMSNLMFFRYLEIGKDRFNHMMVLIEFKD